MLNVKKSTDPKPGSKYNDVLRKPVIHSDFYCCCYICEEYISLRNFVIDHFFPQKHFPILVDDWKNLFCSCGKCNSIKSDSYNQNATTEILNCCEDDVEKLIELEFDTQNDKVLIRPTSTSVQIQNTVQLLESIYNDEKFNSKSLRDDIKGKLKEIIEEIDVYKKRKIAKQGYETEIANLLKKKENSYVSFKRSIIKKDTKLVEVFAKYFD